LYLIPSEDNCVYRIDTDKTFETLLREEQHVKVKINEIVKIVKNQFKEKSLINILF